MNPLTLPTVRLLLRTVTVCAGTLVLTCAGLSTADADDGPRLLFQVNGQSRTLIAVADRDGTGATRPVADLAGGDQTNPDWSPSGRRFTFAMSDGNADDLWVARTSGHRARRLVDCQAPCLYLDDPAWSPDGDTIAFSRTVVRDGTGVSTLETVEVATGRTEVLLGPFTHRFTAGARWSPSGRQLVFEMVQKTGPGVDDEVTGVTLSVVRLTGDRPVRGLTDPAVFAATADWSPRRGWIVYSALATPTGEAPDLFRVRPWGGDPVRITRLAAGGGYAAEPTFTPSGRSVVFSGGRGAGEGDLLLRVALDGSGLRPLAAAAEITGRHPRVR